MYISLLRVGKLSKYLRERTPPDGPFRKSARGMTDRRQSRLFEARWGGGGCASADDYRTFEKFVAELYARGRKSLIIYYMSAATSSNGRNFHATTILLVGRRRFSSRRWARRDCPSRKRRGAVRSSEPRPTQCVCVCVWIRASNRRRT